MRIQFIVFIIFSLFFTYCTNGQNKTNKLLGNDIRLFEDVAWDLAQAVEREDTVQMKKILDRGKVNVDVREGKFGMSLLIWSMSEKKYHSAEILLRYGADPNLQDLYDGTSAITAAADNFKSSEFLKLALKYGGDPNNEVISIKPILNYTPLVVAARNRLESVILLIEAGAEINKGVDKKQSALFVAVRFEQVEIVRYLLIEKKAEFRLPVFANEEGDDLYLADFLRGWVYPLDSDKYKVKMEIVEFLKTNGMDYWKTKIPEHFYQQYSTDFLKKY